MKRSTKQLLSMLLAIVMVVGLMAPAMAAMPMMGEVAETPVEAEAPAAGRPAAKAPAKADLASAEDGVYTLDLATEFTANVAAADMAEKVHGNTYGTKKADGTTGYFTITGGEETKEGVTTPKGRIDAKQNKDFADGYKGTVRFNFEMGGTKDGPCVTFTTADKALVQVWWAKGDADRQMAILDSTGAEVAGAKTTDVAAKNDPVISYLTVPAAGTYHLVADPKSNYLFKVEVTEGTDTVPTATDATAEEIGTPAITAALAADSTDTVEAVVTGVAVGVSADGTKKFADNLVVETYDGSEKVATSKAVIYADKASTEGTKFTIDLAALGTGSYTFKAVATKGDTKYESAATTPAIDYTLPLAAPANVSATVTSATSVTVEWNAVREATGYEVYQDDVKVTAGTIQTSEDGSKASLLVEGLTTGTKYTFTVKALRDTEVSAASDPAEATPAEGVATAKRTYILNVGKDLEDIGKGAMAVGNTVKGGTSNFFTINGGAKLEIQANEATFDGVKYTKRLKTGTKYKAGAAEGSENYYKDNSIKFTVEGPSTVKVFWKAGGTGDPARSLVILSEDGATEIAETKKSNDGSVACIDTLTVANAGTYYMHSKENGCNIYYIEVVSELPINTYEFTLDVGRDVEPFAKGALAEGDSLKAGKAGDGTTDAYYFTINGGAKIQVQAAKKPYDDGYEATARLRPGCTHVKPTGDEEKDAAAEGYIKNNSVKIETDGSAEVKLWWYSDKGTGDNRYVAIWDEAGNQIAATPEATTGDPTITELAIPEAGTYYFVCPANSCTISKIWVKETVAGTKKLPAPADWTETAGSAAVTGTAGTDGTLTATVTGVMVGEGEGEAGALTYPAYADSVKVDLFQGETVTGEAVDSIKSTKAMAATTETQDLVFKPDATGKYILQLTVARAMDKQSKVVTSSVVEFTLPLKTPSINSAASNGLEEGKDTASMAVSWTSVPEASSYNLYYKVKDAADWSEAIVVPATEDANVNATVPGLTVGTEYEFTVEAVRDAGTIGGVSVTAETTAKSAVKSAVAAGKKQIPWTTKVFGTSASTAYNSIITGNYEADFSVVTNGAKRVEEAGPKTWTDPVTGEIWDKKPEYAPNSQHKETVTGLTGDLNTDPGNPVLNEDGTPKLDEDGNPVYDGNARILLSSRAGSGKITEPSGSDGLMFHYTTVPAGYNYSLKAKVHVTRWFTRDTQNGLGLAALDRVPATSQSGSTGSNAGDYWNNSYMVGAARVPFRYDGENAKAYAATDLGADAYTNYSYYMGLCAITKHGTPEGYDKPGAVSDNYQYRRFPLDTRLPNDSITAKYNNQNNRFNIIGNFEALPAGWSTMSDANGQKVMSKYELTDFILELKKTPTGYTSTAWTLDGKLLGTNTEYYAKGAAELSGADDNNPYTHTVAVNPENAVDQSGNAAKNITNMDASAEYVGLFTSRDTDALFSNVEFKMWPQSEDQEPAQTPPITVVRPTLSIASGSSSNTKDFKLSIATNVDGWVTISQEGNVVASDVPIKGEERLDYPVELKVGANNFKVSFKLDLEQVNASDWPPFTELDTVNLPKDATSTVTYKTFYQELNNIYVSPNANSTGRGTRNSPVDVHTAVSVAAPGQKIILLPGEYKLTKTIRIGRGMDGTAEKPIYFIADPERAEGEKVVLNGQGSAGSVLVHGSNYWIFKDFEVVGSSSGATGFQISGSNNIVQRVDTHDNGSTGMQIGRLSSSDRIPVRDKPDVPANKVTDWGDWPCNNTIINCSSYRNYDSGYNGADGFGAKQTVGAGNVFDGCVAYWNADDGWDLFAKSEPDMGCLGVVTLKNCITFQNGYEVRKIINTATQQCEMEADGYTPKMNLDENGKIILTDAGNGNGFKLGGNHLPGAHVIENSYAFYNKAKGFDSNNGPDISVIGCTAFNNGDENVGLSSNATLAFVVKNVVSFKNDDAYTGNEGIKGMKDRIKEGSGNKIDKGTYYAWTPAASSDDVGVKSTNGTTEITEANFASLDFDNTQWVNGAPRDENGTLQLGDFLKLVNVTDAGAGELTNDVTPVPPVEVIPDPETEGNGGGSSSGGNGGTAAAPKPGEKPVEDDDKPAPDKTYTADKTTDVEGNTEIVVKDNEGEVVADVKIPATIPAPETKFDDVPADHWAEESINNMAALGVVNGVGGNKYDMDSAVTRGTIATMLFRFANGKSGKANPFTDVAAGKWYTDAIAWAADSGVVTGYSETTFGPDDTITREQLAVMLYRFAKLIGMDGTVADSALADYNDVASVDNWAEEGMAWCVSKGIINGVSADTLSPTTSATRAQTATMLNRFIGLMK